MKNIQQRCVTRTKQKDYYARMLLAICRLSKIDKERNCKNLRKRVPMISEKSHKIGKSSTHRRRGNVTFFFLGNTKANDRGDASERSIRSARGTRLEGRKRAPGGRTRGSSRVDDRPGTEKAEGSKDCHAPLIPFRPLFRLHPPSFIHERNYQPLLFIIPGLTVQLCIVTRTVPPGKGKVARPVRMCRSPVGKEEGRGRFRTIPSFRQSRNFQKLFTWKIQPLVVTFFNDSHWKFF